MEIERELILWFLNYFKRVSRRNPDNDHWIRGFHLAEKWLKIFDNNSATQEDIDSLMGELRSEFWPGTGWCEMTAKFWFWAKDKGYIVPDLQDVYKDQYPDPVA